MTATSTGQALNFHGNVPSVLTTTQEVGVTFKGTRRGRAPGGAKMLTPGRPETHQGPQAPCPANISDGRSEMPYEWYGGARRETAPADKGPPRAVAAGGALHWDPGQPALPGPRWRPIAGSPFLEGPSPEAAADRGMSLFGGCFALFHRNQREGRTWGRGWALEAVQRPGAPALNPFCPPLGDCLSLSPGQKEGDMCVQMCNEPLPPPFGTLRSRAVGLPAPPLPRPRVRPQPQCDSASHHHIPHITRIPWDSWIPPP